MASVNKSSVLTFLTEWHESSIIWAVHTDRPNGQYIKWADECTPGVTLCSCDTKILHYLLLSAEFFPVHYFRATTFVRAFFYVASGHLFLYIILEWRE